MTFLSKQRAAIDFCRTHPGQAFDEGKYDSTLEVATPERLTVYRVALDFVKQVLRRFVRRV